jgi:SAM-dependent methyltransferase
MRVTEDQPAPPPAPAALPPYAPMLAAYQRAHAAELRAMIADLRPPPGGLVLDVACGAGAYACWLAEEIGPDGQVIGLDIDPAFLAEAAAAVEAAGLGGRVRLQRADGARLPFDDGSFDLVWCAQSMDSLPEPRATLRELARVARPGGRVAIFENDAIHQVILPWPAGLELAVRQAQLRSFVAGRLRPQRYSIARRFRAALREAGLAHCHVAAYPSVRHAPLEPDERAFLAAYLDGLRGRAAPFLEGRLRERFEALVDPASPDYMLDDPDLCVTYIDFLACGVKDEAAARPSARRSRPRSS